MKIALVGYGVEGQSAYTYFLREYPEAEFVIYDEAESPKYDTPADVAFVSGPDVLNDEIDADIVVRTPAVRPDKLRTSGRVTSVTEEFLLNCPAPIIGVTGTKGKGTTASLIHSILQADGKTSWLVGNIGVSALDILPKVKPSDIVVYELSSFQLWDVTKSPHVAVVLMIEPDHLDVHVDMEDYIMAKANIRKFQKDDDVCFYYPDNKYSLRVAFAEGSKGRAVRYGTPDEPAVYVKSNTFFIHNDPICATNNLQLPGDHNLGNACAAISAAEEFGVSNDAVAKGLQSFTGLPHRLKFVREVNGVRFYDDSIATTPGSAIAALKAFADPKVIILGGSEKGVQYDAVIEECKKQKAKVIAIGTIGPKIAKLCRDNEVEVHEFTAQSMAEIVRLSANTASKGEVVILSPAAASFDMFKSYVDRGEQFVAAVEAL